MFTSTMTNAELQHEAYLDFLEMKAPIRIAFSNYRWHLNSSLGKKQRYYIHNIVQTKSYRTKRNNTWQIEFHSNYYTKENAMVGGCVIYIALDRGEHREYIFLRDIESFAPERVTSHFLQRYKERYLEPNGINLKGMNPALYFQRNSDDMCPTEFYPENWTEDDMINKMIWLSKQGLFVTEMEDKMRVYITFLDQKNLSRYKAMVYEEENYKRLYNEAKNVKDPIEQAKRLACVYRNPKARDLEERYLRRTTSHVLYKREEQIQNCLAAWDRMVEATFQLLDKLKELGMEGEKPKIK